MRACLVFICFLAATFALSVNSKPHGKRHGLRKNSHPAKEKDVITEEANKPEILPTLVPIEASSQEQEDEELSSEDNGNANKEEEEFQLTERNDKSSAVLLSEEELVDLLKREAKEEQEAEERELEEEELESEKVKVETDEDEEAEEKKLNDGLKTEEDIKEETNEGEGVKKESADDDEKKVEEVEEVEVEQMPQKKKEKIQEESDGSTESEIPADLDYAADGSILQPLQIVPTKLKSLPDDIQPLSQTDAKETETTAADDFEHEVQNTEAASSEEESDGDMMNKHPKAQSKGESAGKKESAENVDPQEPKSGTEFDTESRPAVEGEEKSKNESGSHSKGKTRKQKKNQRARKHSPQSDETQPAQEPSRQDDQEAEGGNIDNAVHKTKRRRAGKWGPLVGMNPVQIRATVDLYPSSRSSLGGGAHRSDAPEDPCDNFPCKRGKMCKLDPDNKPSCVCQEPSECPSSVNEIDHVCGTDNKTYDTSCELFATKCKLEGTKRGHKLHLDYTGSCKLIPQCVDTELIQFPLRMRDWLKNVLLQLYEHDSMSPGFLTPKQRFRVKKIFESERRLHAGDHSVELLAQDFEKNYNMYIYPVHWQFAQLDQHPSDRVLSHSELAPLRVPLVPMEHCTSRFFHECDADKDKQVSFKEWTSCFGIKDEDMDTNLLF
ncbi:SPARC-like protein 1 [Xyrichtys novacula]|uniref:SPARC-like protein 1 n=1 Tax=Xyrichtys novacula TaxID=13765 RepID=A0AAV1EUF6_XYRNO|nr:SPARC-like protein 1 [Xyrichtys novacula]